MDIDLDIWIELLDCDDSGDEVIELLDCDDSGDEVL